MERSSEHPAILLNRSDFRFAMLMFPPGLAEILNHCVLVCNATRQTWELSLATVPRDMSGDALMSRQFPYPARSEPRLDGSVLGPRQFALKRLGR